MPLHRTSSVPPPDDAARQQACLILQTALTTSLPVDKQQWLSDQLALVAIEKSNRVVDLAFGLCPRTMGRDTLVFTPLQLNQLQQNIPNWQVSTLGCDAAARIVILSTFTDTEQLATQLGRLLRHADLQEQLAIYRGLPLYAPSQALNQHVAEGLRSNLSDVFTAIAHNNPYAAWHLDTHRYNHMILKALFIDVPLAPIIGLAERNNAELVRMLLEMARERRAASRAVSEELWSLAYPLMSADERCEFELEKAS